MTNYERIFNKPDLSKCVNKYVDIYYAGLIQTYHIFQIIHVTDVYWKEKKILLDL